MATLEKMARVAFGLFEADLQSGELWRGGFRIRLQGLPFRVLAALLAKPGQVVTREELQLQVWGTETTVDFERALSVAIKKVREALADSAENPRFVETLPKRGYRFIAPVTVVLVAPPELESPPPAEGQGLGLLALVEAATVSPVASGERRAPDSLEAGSAWSHSMVEDPSVKQRANNRRRWTRLELILSATTVLLVFALLSAMLFEAKPHTLAPVRVEQLTQGGPISFGPPGMENLLSLVPDGDRVLSTVLVDGKPQLGTVDVSTGDVQRLALPEELVSASIADISKDGSHLLLRSHLSAQSEQPLWVVPIAGGSALRVGNVVAHDATWMPSGTDILIANGDKLTLVSLDGSSATTYATLPGRAFWLRWSPDGALLRFTLMNPQTHSSSIWQLDSRTRAALPLLSEWSGGSMTCCGTWTADGENYVFQVSSLASSNLWKVTGTGHASRPVQLTNGPLRYFSPVAARSGHRIFFYGPDQQMGLQQYVADRHQFLPERPFLANANRVDYSRDGRWVAWTETNGTLWRARAQDGSETLQLTPDSMEVFSGQWSPDGRSLAVMARAPGKVWQLYLIHADGGKPEKLLDDGRNMADPSWSPDGKHLAFGREPDLMGKDNGPHDIEVLDLASRRTTALQNSEGLFSPRWSANGRWIAALSMDQKTIMLCDTGTGQWKELAATSAADPVWSSDSKALYVHAFLAPQQPILRIKVPSGELHPVASLANFGVGAAADYFFGGLTPENAPLVRPRVGTGNLYSLDLPR